MIGYDYTDPIMQTPEEDDEDKLFIETGEKIYDLLENNGFGIVASMLAGTDDWIKAINAYIDEQNQRRNEI